MTSRVAMAVLAAAVMASACWSSLEGPCVCERTIGRVDCICEPPLMAPAEPDMATAIPRVQTTAEPPWRSWIPEPEPEPTPATPRPIPTIYFRALDPVEGKRSAWVRIGSSVPTSGYVGRITMDSDVADPYTARIHWRGWDTGPADGDSPTQESQIWAVRAGATTVTWSLSCAGECRVGSPASVTWDLP